MLSECCISDLKDKEVINICTGKRLGYVCDVYVDVCNGRLVSIVVPYSGGKLLGFGKTKDIIIPWAEIEKIGDDLIIVRLENIVEIETENELKEDKRHKFFF